MTNAVAPIRAGQVRPKLDQICADAVDIARDAVTEDVAGPYIEAIAEGERLVTHYFACTMAGYRGWRWAVTVARTSRSKQVTICETVLLPGPDALTTPEWVPWNERVQPGDLGVGDLMPTAADDDRLVPGYLLSEDPAVDDVVWELGLGRVRVMSREGRIDAAERWYEGEHGPQAPIAVAAPANARCVSCGFFLPLAGSMSALFGACANLYAPDDGRVVSGDHGCGAHSEVLVEPTVEVDEAPTIYDDAEVEPVAVQVGAADVLTVELDAQVADDVSTLTETPVVDVLTSDVEASLTSAEAAVLEAPLTAAEVETEAVDVEAPILPVEAWAVADVEPVGETFAPIESDRAVAEDLGRDDDAFVPVESVVAEEPIADAFVPVESDGVDPVEAEPIVEAFVPVEADDVTASEPVEVEVESVAEAFVPDSDDVEVEPVVDVFVPVEGDLVEGRLVAEEFVSVADDVEAGNTDESIEVDDVTIVAPIEDASAVSVVEDATDPAVEPVAPTETDGADPSVGELEAVVELAEIDEATTAGAESIETADPTVEELEAVAEIFAPVDEIEPASFDVHDYAVEPAGYVEEPAAPSAFDLGSEIPATDVDDASETRATAESFEQLAVVEPPVEQVEPEYPANDAETPPVFDLGSDVSTDEDPHRS